MVRSRVGRRDWAGVSAGAQVLPSPVAHSLGIFLSNLRLPFERLSIPTSSTAAKHTVSATPPWMLGSISVARLGNERVAHTDGLSVERQQCLLALTRFRI